MVVRPYVNPYKLMTTVIDYGLIVASGVISIMFGMIR